LLTNSFAKLLVLFAVALALFMEALDTTIINTAIPAISRSLQTNPIDLKIALISYLLSLTIFIPVSGWVADKLGAKKVFIAALIIFTLSSILCGFAQSLLQLIIARALQGIGGALMLPIGRLILFRSFQKHELIANMSRVVMVAALGLMLGPVLGGLITHYLSWHWIFWVNLPVGLFAILMAQVFLPSMPPQQVSPLDKIGFVLFGTGLSTLTFGMSAFSETAVSGHVALIFIIVAIVSLSLYVMHARRCEHALVRIQLFRLRSFQVSVLGNLVSRLGFAGVPFLLPILLQIPLHYSAQTAGFLIAPTALGVLFVKPFSLQFIRMFGYKKLLILNTLLVALSLWSFMTITAATPLAIIAVQTFIFGFLISMQYTAMNTLAYADVMPTELNAATTFMSTIQQLSQSFGVAASALLIHSFSQYFQQSFSLTIGIFQHTFFAMGILTIGSMLVFVRLRKNDGHQMIEVKS
jgi:EmrB/QacA subfamily drug resistance transporter